MKQLFLILCVALPFSIKAQDTIQKINIQDTTKIKGRLFGGLESNSQWYLNDTKREITHPKKPFRSNDYLSVNYNYGKWTAGIQAESYEPGALLNYNPKYKNANVSTYYANYKTTKLDITAGYFYEQFGSGLLLRSWEDRSLGINNAIRGGRITFKPNENLTFTGLYGRHKTGFDVSHSDIYGFNSDINLSGLTKIESFDLSLGFSYVGRYEKPNIENPNFKPLTNGYATRISFNRKSFYFSSEYNFKTKDAVIYNNKINNDFVKAGNAFLFNIGYSKKGLGLDASFRRIENMNFYSERVPTIYPNAEQSSTSFVYNDRIMNFVPSLTKQHHSNLANIYVYQAQKQVVLDPNNGIAKTGEIGGQIDFFYVFKKQTALGGKFGTKLAINASNWYNLKANTVLFPPAYQTDFLGSEKKYFSDYNIEISKKFNSKLSGGIAYINQYYNNRMITGAANVEINTNIIAPELTYLFSGSKSVKLSLEHMWADSDRKNWAAMLLEYSHNSNFSFYISDMYNYGYDKESNLIDHQTDRFKIHFVNLGGAYKKGSTRLSLNYGRQRGGLVCAGGVCRFVPPSTGLSISLNTSF